MKVKEIMSRRLITIDVDRNINDAIKLMKRKKVSRLLVKDKGKIIGIITERDIARRLGYWKERKLPVTHIYVSSAYTKDLKTIDEEADISEASKLMSKYKISSLVVTKENEVCGIITKTDLIKSLKDNKTPVKEIMKKPITVPLGSSLLRARRIMIENRIKRLLVLRGNELVGIVTEGDIARALTSFRKFVEDKHLDKRMKEIKIDDVMTKDLITIDEGRSIGEAASIMVKKDISSLPVVKDGKLIGIVTKTDLIKVLI